jgi:alpha-tubulin suppressor-like RCC1 family protein
MRRALFVLGLVVIGCSTDGVIGSLASDTPPPGAAGDDSDAGGDDAGPAGPVPREANAVGAGGASTCVRTASKGARCWGENQTGSLGIGDDSVKTSATPVTPQSLDHVAAIASGQTSQCALKEDGTVLCWGDIYVGDFASGGGVQTFTHLPVMNPLGIDGVGSVARVAVGLYFTCLLGTNGELRCYGMNDVGQLGVGSTEIKALPTTVNGFDGSVRAVSASMGGQYTCAVTSAGSVWCWGKLPRAGVVTSPRRVDGIDDAVDIAVGSAHACIRTKSGGVRCWGANGYGQLGNGENADSDTPKDTLYLSDIAMIATGANHTCAVRTEGTVFCWGDNANKQLGDSTDGTRPSLVLPASFAARFVSCGMAHTCAWGDGGHVKCWGADESFELGPQDATF